VAPRKEPILSGNKPIVLVTGSSGLIGSAVVHRLADTYTVVGFDKPGLPNPPPEAKAMDVDLTDDASVKRGLHELKAHFGPSLAGVVHLAAYYDFSGAPSPLYEQVTVRGTERLLQGLHALQFEVGRFIFSSTMLVHAPCEVGQKIDEQWPLDPKWDYPRSKVRTEHVIAVERGRTPVLILRIAGVYTDRCQSLPLSHQIQRIAEKQLESHVFPGDLTHGQSMVHLDDLAEAIRLGIDRGPSLPDISIVLIGEDRVMSYGQLQDAFGRLLWDKPWETREIPKVVAKTGSWLENHLDPWGNFFIKPWMIDLCDDHYDLDISRAKQQLGWSPRHALEQSLKTMIDALNDDAVKWYEENKLKKQ
jgi:nucleoside-diphosphate-sugar epimerase